MEEEERKEEVRVRGHGGPGSNSVFDHDRTSVLISSQQLDLPAEDVHKIKPSTVHHGEGHSSLHCLLTSLVSDITSA